MKPRYPGWAAADQQAMADGKPYIKPDGEIASADEIAAAQERRPGMLDILKESPTRPRDRPHDAAQTP